MIAAVPLLALLGCAPRGLPPAELAAPAPLPARLPPPEDSTMPAVELHELEALGVFPVTPLPGLVSSPVSGLPSAWFAVTVGSATLVDGELEWASWQRGPQSEDEVVLDTPSGRLTLSWRSLRPHLSPAWVRTFREWADLPQSPNWLRPRLEGAFGEGPVTVAEYSLQAGRSYFATVRTESYMLPPDAEGAGPREGVNRVLVVGDEAWEGPRPAAKLVPAFEGWSY